MWVVSKADMRNCLFLRILLQKKNEMNKVVKVEYQVLLLQVLLMGEIDRSSTGGVNPVWGCLINPIRLD
jgi:hypothetical protein